MLVLFQRLKSQLFLLELELKDWRCGFLKKDDISDVNLFFRKLGFSEIH